ncbi:hypothetical protein MKZ38_003545 [Zalerion maritima]|uniref:Alpha-L-rhamnosidase six-hairpin glycosidase domain-containing protein n=1 Tax=Zalerion maritima TaxID=339359 RepID=A0AAD5RP29_9PEZI|nr:hypothetical protein MKZ38_003545 [Zalerion maritima]
MSDNIFLFSPSKWIWLPTFDDTAAVGQFVCFRRSFELEDTSISPTLLHVSADTRYELYVNGKSISFGPCKSYTTRWNYETADIAPFLVQGTNVLGARVLRLSSSFPGCLSMARTPLPGLIVHCELPLVGDAGGNIHTDERWKAAKDPGTQLVGDSEWDYRLGPPFLNLNEKVDGLARLDPQDWLAASFDDKTWSHAIENTVRRKMSPMLDARRLFPREIPPMAEQDCRFDGVVKTTSPLPRESWMKLISEGTPLRLAAGTEHVVYIESKQLTTGFLHIECMLGGKACDNPPTIELLCAECFEPRMSEGAPRRKGDRTDHENGVLYGPVDTFTPRPGNNHYSPFWFRTFRYIRLRIIPPANNCGGKSFVTINSLAYRSTHYPLDIKSTIQTTSPLVTKLWDVSLHTLRNCMHETYEDCPFYEQNQFAMDSRSMMLFTYLVSRDDRLARKTMREFYASRRDDGLVETHFPTPERSVNIPTFSLFWVLMVWDHMVHFGDEILVRDYMGAIDGVLNFFEGRRRGTGDVGLVGQFDPDCWAFVDWVDGWETPGKGFLGLAVPRAYYEKGAATFHSMLYAYSLLKAAELAVFLGRRDTAEEYRRRHRELVRAVRSHCFDPETGLYLDGPGVSSSQVSQHVQVFAVLAGCVQEECSAMELMRKTVLRREEYGMAKASFAMGFYMFRAASHAGVYEECWPTLIRPWEKMISQNMTTWAESDSMERSDCHGWSSAPLWEIGTEILGLQPRSKAYVDTVGRDGQSSGDIDVEKEILVLPRTSLVEDICGTLVVGTRGAGEGLVRIRWDMRREPEVEIGC